MACVFFPNPHLMPPGPVCWVLVQTGMTVGCFASWPANVWLIRRGIKEATQGRGPAWRPGTQEFSPRGRR
jgi:hypothetical protein